MADAADQQPVEQPPVASRLLIVPFNYDPLDPLAYMRQTGDAAIAPGLSRMTRTRPEGKIHLAVAEEEAGPAPEGVAGPDLGKGNAEEPKLGPDVPWALPAHCMGPFLSYSDAYAEVPFSRTEYEANPSYRQEAAMELMFRTLRPATIVKQNAPYTIRYPDFYRYPFSRYPNFQRLDVHQFGSGYPGVLYPSYAP